MTAAFHTTGAGLTAVSNGDTIVLRRHGWLCKPGHWRVTRLSSPMTCRFFDIPGWQSADAVVDDFGNLVRVS